MRDSLILYTAYLEKFQKLSDEQFGRLVRAMLEYQSSGVIPVIGDAAVALSFDVVKVDLDKNNDKYDKVVQRNRENGKKGGRPKQENPVGFLGTQTNPEEPKKADNDNDNDNGIKDNTKKNVKEKNRVRHIYGEYKHVRLSDDEYARLVADYGEEETAGAIRILDEYCEQTGRTYKNHSLALRKWAYAALKEERGKKSTQGSKMDSRVNLMGAEPTEKSKAQLRNIENLYFQGVRRNG